MHVARYGRDVNLEGSMRNGMYDIWGVLREMGRMISGVLGCRDMHDEDRVEREFMSGYARLRSCRP